MSNSDNIGSSKPKIEVKNLSFHYGSKQVLFGIDLAIRPNCVTSIIGPSGCGKSTILGAINRMNDLIPGARVAGGTVEIEGEDIYRPGTDVVKLRQRVGMVFQKSHPFPKSIFDNVAYGPRLHKKSKLGKLEETVENSLRRAALWDEVKDRLNDSALKLSGGQQQRLCIARALAVNPEIILMDEPASFLDPKSTARIEELITALGTDYTIVIVTHNMQQAARVSQYTAFVYEGQLVEYNPTTVVFTRPTNPKTEDYITGRFG